MLYTKKAIPTKAGIAKFINVWTTYKLNFNTNQMACTVEYIDAVYGCLFTFINKQISNAGVLLIATKAYCNLGNKGGNNGRY